MWLASLLLYVMVINSGDPLAGLRENPDPEAKRMMEENLKLVDVVVEMLDARIPKSSSNPMLLKMIGAKPKVIALNKTDMADPNATKAWLEKATAPVSR